MWGISVTKYLQLHSIEHLFCMPDNQVLEQEVLKIQAFMPIQTLTLQLAKLYKSNSEKVEIFVNFRPINHSQDKLGREIVALVKSFSPDDLPGKWPTLWVHVQMPAHLVDG